MGFTKPAQGIIIFVLRSKVSAIFRTFHIAVRWQQLEQLTKQLSDFGLMSNVITII